MHKDQIPFLFFSLGLLGIFSVLCLKIWAKSPHSINEWCKKMLWAPISMAAHRKGSSAVWMAKTPGFIPSNIPLPTEKAKASHIQMLGQRGRILLWVLPVSWSSWETKTTVELSSLKKEELCLKFPYPEISLDAELRVFCHQHRILSERVWKNLFFFFF